MLTRKRLVVAAALLAISSSVTPAQAQTVSRDGSVQAQRVRPGGSVIDSQGRRYWNGRRDHTSDAVDTQGFRRSDGNWHNGCFRSLGYLDAASACGGGSSGDGG
jgi:hypothetical protein